MTMGVYAIYNAISGQTYIGSSKNAENRWTTHRHALKMGRHRNSVLQADWNRDGASAFHFTILEEVKRLPDLALAEIRHATEIDPVLRYESDLITRNDEGLFLLPMLRIVRVKAGLSMRDLAAAAEVALDTVNRLEHGEPARPRTIRKLAAALGVAPADLTDPIEPSKEE
jgi:DNA-binding Xre family transcriptional regulator